MPALLITVEEAVSMFKKAANVLGKLALFGQFFLGEPISEELLEHVISNCELSTDEHVALKMIANAPDRKDQALFALVYTALRKEPVNVDVHEHIQQ